MWSITSCAPLSEMAHRRDWPVSRSLGQAVVLGTAFVHRLNRFGPAGLVGLCISLSLSPLASAETVWNGEVFGDWQYECAVHAEGVTQCALVQSIIDTEINEPMVRLSFARSTVDETVTASVLLPLGVDLAEGASLQYGAQKILLPYRMCVHEGCLARKYMSAEDLRHLARAEHLTVGFHAVGRSAVAEAPASNRGLREAFHRLGFILGE